LAALVGGATASGADELYDCGLEQTRTRNIDERVCYEEFGPKSLNWGPGHHGALDGCLEQVHAQYDAAIERCHALYVMPTPEAAPLDPHKTALGAATIISFILLFSI